MIVRLQSDQVITKESKLPVYDKPDHKNKSKIQKWAWIKVLRNCALNLTPLLTSLAAEWRIVVMCL